MSNLVYLMCSLPSLKFGQVPPISMEEFTADAKSQLSAKHFKKLEPVDIYQATDSEGKVSLKRIAVMLDEMKEDMAELRAAKAQRRTPGLTRFPVTVVHANPLEREKLIMRWQWEELDSIVAGEAFTLTEIMVYKLRLQILNRLNSFDNERGSQVLASVVNPPKKKEE
ncbi:DUF2764 family protein [Carboxylicivirga sp. A043]|uniref:DUF2764 domain-containing protein n=1 Tax=Carboxylicivirga litoralis TaxID=2816963 RepID=UPI0021CAF7BB|nr:DUF2764 domain-containing protein [Carboxylicivirga sp. A043]MCU4154733.1 DUF2764 family protein [Carboxylicivirga sp. A043]